MAEGMGGEGAPIAMFEVESGEVVIDDVSNPPAGEAIIGWLW